MTSEITTSRILSPLPGIRKGGEKNPSRFPISDLSELMARRPGNALVVHRALGFRHVCGMVTGGM